MSELAARFAARGSPRLKAQRKVILRCFHQLNSSDDETRRIALQALEYFRPYLLSRERIRCFGHRRLLFVHLLEVARRYSADNRWPYELHELSTSLQWLLRHFPCRERGDSRRRVRAAQLIEYLESEDLRARRYQECWDQFYLWQGLMQQKDWSNLTAVLLKASWQEHNAFLRAQAFRFLAEQRSSIPVGFLNTAIMLDAVHTPVLLQAEGEELEWFAAALVTTCSCEELNVEDELWSRAKALMARVLAESDSRLSPSLCQSVREFFALC